MVDALSGGAPEQAPRWDLVDTKSCGVGIRFSWIPLLVWGYVGIYRRKKYVSGATWAPRGWRARPPWACPLSRGPLGRPPTYFFLLYIPTYPKNIQGANEKNSTAITFYIREIPSWSLRRCSAGGGIDHGGILHQHHGPSDEL